MKKFSLIVIILFIFFYILIEIVGDRFIKGVLESNISNSLSREVTIEKLSIDYLSGEAQAEKIKLLNKKFDGSLAEVERVKVNLDAFSIFSNDISINDVQLSNINLNYYFKFSDRITSDNLRNLQKDLEFKNTNSQSNKFFNIKNLDAKNINLAVLSPDFDFEKTFSINDMNFKDIGNTEDSKNYKDILKKVFKDMVVDVREKIMSNNLLDTLENLNIEEIENKVKDKLKNKLKSLIN
tara:strand:- start:154 stop:867 length:714 start_codon:yes stop_codon:yes gene_type:complete